MGRRRRRSRGGISRRRFLVGGLLGLGGVSILGGTQAFSRTDATRATAVDAAGDENALLGVAPAASVQSGASGQHLVTLTNNTDRTLAVTIALDDPSQGSLSQTSGSIPSGGTLDVAVSVASDSPTGTDALSFSVTAADGADFSVSLSRAVDVVAGPELRQQVYDQTSNTNASYAVAYSVRNVTGFDRIEITVENLDAGHIGPETYVRTSAEGTIDYPPGGGSDGGAADDTYEFRFRVFDDAGRVTQLDDSFTDTADGSNPPGDDFGGPNSSTLDSFTVQDDSQNTNTDLTVTYQATDNGDFDHVTVTFDNQTNAWADATETNASTSGSVGYSQGGTMGDPYDVTVEVVNANGIVVDSGSVTYTPDGGSGTSWP